MNLSPPRKYAQGKVRRNPPLAAIVIDCISAGVDRMQRNFEPLRRQVDGWQQVLADVTAKVVIYEAFVEGKLEAPKHLHKVPAVRLSSIHLTGT